MAKCMYIYTEEARPTDYQLHLGVEVQLGKKETTIRKLKLELVHERTATPPSVCALGSFSFFPGCVRPSREYSLAMIPASVEPLV